MQKHGTVAFNLLKNKNIPGTGFSVTFHDKGSWVLGAQNFGGFTGEYHGCRQVKPRNIRIEGQSTKHSDYFEATI